MVYFCARFSGSPGRSDSKKIAYRVACPFSTFSTSWWGGSRTMLIWDHCLEICAQPLWYNNAKVTSPILWKMTLPEQVLQDHQIEAHGFFDIAHESTQGYFFHIPFTRDIWGSLALRETYGTWPFNKIWLTKFHCRRVQDGDIAGECLWRNTTHYNIKLIMLATSPKPQFNPLCAS